MPSAPRISRHIVEPYLERNTLNILGGDSGAGKTRMLFQILGDERLEGRFGRLVQISLDRKASTYERLFDKLGIPSARRWEIVSLHDHFDRVFPVNDLTNPELRATRAQQVHDWVESSVMKTLKWAIRIATPFDTVVIDPASRLLPTSKVNDLRAVANAMAVIASSMAHWQTVILTWHLNKLPANQRPDIFSALSGSASLSGSSDSKFVIALPGNVPKSWPAPALYMKGQHFPKSWVGLRRSDEGHAKLPPGFWELQGVPTPYEDDPENEEARAESGPGLAIMERLTEGAATAAEISKDTGLTLRSVQRHLKILIEAGKVVKDGTFYMLDPSTSV